MAYGQRIYPQQLGLGNQTIAESGCFLTAFCNYLQKWEGQNIDPPALNDWFKANGAYLADPANGGADELAWSSLTRYNGNIVVTGQGFSDMPANANAIVKFHYRSFSHPTLPNGQPNMIDHFCAVDRIVDGQVYIIDSWDGAVKSPTGYSGYGRPVAWATYGDRPAPAPAPAPSGMSNFVPASIPTSTDPYRIVVMVPGYRTSSQAANRQNPVNNIPVGTYMIYNQANGMINITTRQGVPGAWINPADNVVPAEPTTPAPAPAAGNYTVLAAVPGYASSNAAANHLGLAPVTVQPGNYFIFNQSHGMVNVTKTDGKPGAWINPSDNNAPAAPEAAPAALVVQTPAPAPAAAPAAPVVPTAPNFRSSYKPFAIQPSMYVATETVVIHDLAELRPDVMLHQYDLVPLAGTFTGPDGVLYGRTMNSAFPNLRRDPAARALGSYYYGLPMNLLIPVSEVTPAPAPAGMNFYDNLVKTAGGFSGWINRLQQALKIKKETK